MTKPEVRIRSRGESGNIYAIMARAAVALVKQGRADDYNRMRDEVTACKSYKAAVAAIRKYVTLVDEDGLI